MFRSIGSEHAPAPGRFSLAAAMLWCRRFGVANGTRIVRAAGGGNSAETLHPVGSQPDEAAG